MSVGESSVMVSLYLVILLAQLWLTEPFQAACRMNGTMDASKLERLSFYSAHKKTKQNKQTMKKKSISNAHLEKSSPPPLQVLTLGSGAGPSSPSSGLALAIRLCSSGASASGWPDSWLPGGISVSSSWLSLHSGKLEGMGQPPLLYWGVTAVESRPPDISLCRAEMKRLLWDVGHYRVEFSIVT